MHKLIRANGTEEELIGPISNSDIRALIGADCLGTVTLHHMGEPLHVMLVDDHGWETEIVDKGDQIELRPVRALKPINLKATRLYWQNCIPGTTHQIAGDVVIVPDLDAS